MKLLQEESQVEIVYALPDRQTVVTLVFEERLTVANALTKSGIYALHPELQGLAAAYGIHGRVVAPDQIVKSSDRIEIYRPLIADPKITRRKRAARNRRKA